ncbi:hypothetical protein DIE19_05265 [Burkholderia sp. Bp9126]|nr:hypothetical protein DIE19_05265 [Burkholderia sp. Bp9126]
MIGAAPFHVDGAARDARAPARPVRRVNDARRTPDPILRRRRRPCSRVRLHAGMHGSCRNAGGGARRPAA